MDPDAAVSELPRPRTRTASRCPPRMARGTHSFEVAGYSHLKSSLRAGQFISSSTEKASSAVMTFDSISKNTRFGRAHLMPRSELEASAYLRDDRLVIECDVTVYFTELHVIEMNNGFMDCEVPPRDIAEDLANLLGAEEGADVTFKVQEEVFTAHAIVLAMRSPVFRAEFYGPMKEKGVHQQQQRRTIVVEDMQPAVFNALLHFVYTDCLVFTGINDDLDEDKRELTKHLLVAADRYDIQGLKFLCEKNLRESLDVDSVASMLAFADQHNCVKLKDACVEYITSLHSIDAVVASEGYKNLKESCPTVLVDIFETVANELCAFRNHLIERST